MTLIDRVKKTGNTKAGKIILVYGAPKQGKTSTFCNFPKSLLIQVKDASADALKESGCIPEDMPVLDVTGWDDTLSVLRELVDSEHDYKGILLDGPSGIEEYLDAIVTEENFDNSPTKFAAWGGTQGDKVSGVRWLELLEVLSDLKSKGIWIFMIAHLAVVNVKSPSGNDYSKNVPHLSKSKLTASLKYVDAIIFMDSVIAVKDVNDQSHKGKAVGGSRVMRCGGANPSFEAGNRMGLADVIVLGNSPKEAWDAFALACKNGRKKA
jgi:hypothetical protein